MKKSVIPVLAWSVALLALIGASHELRRERELSDLTRVVADLPQPKVQRQPLALVDYQAIEKKIPLSGTLTVNAAVDGLTLKAAALSDYAAWRLTVDQVLLGNPAVHWNIAYLCSGKCPSGEAHKAVLSGTQLVEH